MAGERMSPFSEVREMRVGLRQPGKTVLTAGGRMMTSTMTMTMTMTVTTTTLRSAGASDFAARGDGLSPGGQEGLMPFQLVAKEVRSPERSPFGEGASKPQSGRHREVISPLVQALDFSEGRHTSSSAFGAWPSPRPSSEAFGQPKTLMRQAAEVGRDRVLGDVFDDDVVVEAAVVELKAPTVAGKPHGPARPNTAQGEAQQARVIFLDVEGAGGATASRKAGRIHHHHVEAFPPTMGPFEPFKGVRAVNAVAIANDAVEREVLLSPARRRRRKVHRCRRRCPC